MVLFDSAVLLLILDGNARAPIDLDTGIQISDAAERIDHLIERLSADNEKIIIPTPVLSEVLVHARDAMADYLDIINRKSVFRVAPFDQKAAIEAALAVRDAIDRGGHRVDAANPDVTKTKIKFDRQIVAIALAEGAHTVYSDDTDVCSYARRAGLKAFRTADLELPPVDPQFPMNFDDLGE